MMNFTPLFILIVDEVFRGYFDRVCRVFVLGLLGFSALSVSCRTIQFRPLEVFLFEIYN